MMNTKRGKENGLAPENRNERGRKMAAYFKAKRSAVDYFNNFPVIQGELLTPKERYTFARYLDDSIFETVEISRKQTYKLFGVRLPKEE